MRFYLDENIPVILATVLAVHGIDCLSSRDAGNLGFTDENQLVFAAREKRILFSFDCKDFIQLAKRWQESGRSHSGILLSRELPLPELLCRLRHFAIRQRDQSFTDRVIWLQKP